MQTKGEMFYWLEKKSLAMTTREIFTWTSDLQWTKAHSNACLLPGKHPVSKIFTAQLNLQTGSHKVHLESLRTGGSESPESKQHIAVWCENTSGPSGEGISQRHVLMASCRLSWAQAQAESPLPLGPYSFPTFLWLFCNEIQPFRHFWLRFWAQECCPWGCWPHTHSRHWSGWPWDTKSWGKVI